LLVRAHSIARPAGKSSLIFTMAELYLYRTSDAVTVASL
jgi:hypothetical protein